MPPTYTGGMNFGWVIPCVLGALGLFLARNAGDGSLGFYAFTFFAATVYALGWWLWGSKSAFAGPRIGRELGRGVLIGAALAIVFVLGALVVQNIPFLAGPVEQLLNTPDQGGLLPTFFVLVINGIGEELVYRDMVPRQLRERFPRLPEISVGVVSTLIYGVVTIAMGVPLLVFSALVLSAVAFYEASRSRRLYSPIAVHLTWSVTMLLVMPLFF